jgi:hypothetical protein
VVAAILDALRAYLAQPRKHDGGQTHVLLPRVHLQARSPARLRVEARWPKIPRLGLPPGEAELFSVPLRETAFGFGSPALGHASCYATPMVMPGTSRTRMMCPSCGPSVLHDVTASTPMENTAVHAVTCVRLSCGHVWHRIIRNTGGIFPGSPRNATVVPCDCGPATGGE